MDGCGANVWNGLVFSMGAILRKEMFKILFLFKQMLDFVTTTVVLSLVSSYLQKKFADQQLTRLSGCLSCAAPFVPYTYI